MRPAAKHPTELELTILQILWSVGPSSGRAVQASLKPAKSLAYTSVITMLNIMTRKGYLSRKKTPGGNFIYSPKITERTNSGKMLNDLLNRVFHGSASALVLKLLEDKRLSKVEIEELRTLVDEESA